MKALLISLFIFASTAICRAASTDMITFITYEQVPIEQKVVELHMTRTEEEPVEEKKRRAKKVETLPFSHGVCSGEFVSPTGDILTAKHCVEGFDSIDVVTFDQQHYVSTVVYKSPNHDLAMIHIDRLDTPYFDLARTLTQGETVYAFGSPLGITGTLSTGIVAKLDGDVTLIDCSVLPGNSGCPLINTNGELIGTVTAGYIVGFGTTHLNLAQSLNVVRFFLFDAFRALKDKRQ